jgi:hypothetical protein
MFFRRINSPEKLEGIGVFQTPFLVKGSAICLPGIGIFLSDSIQGFLQKAVIQHEFGHYLDYLHGYEGDRKRFLGSGLLGFYLKIGLPSLFNLIPGLNLLPWFAGPHRLFWTELRANQLASLYFGETLASDFSFRFPSQA